MVDATKRGFSPRWLAIFLGLFCLFVYNANLRQIGAGDTISARYLPLGILRFGTVTLDPIARWVARGHVSVADWKQKPAAELSVMPKAYWMARGEDQHVVSFYPVVAPLLVTPLYLPARYGLAAAAGRSSGRSNGEIIRLASRRAYLCAYVSASAARRWAVGFSFSSGLCLRH